jgi:hypothetical protein
MNLDALEPGIWNEDVLDLDVKTTYNFGVEKSKDHHFKM